LSAGARFAAALAALTLFVLALFGVVAGALFASLEPAQRTALQALLVQRLPLLVVLALLLPFVLAVPLRWWMRAWPLAAARMAEEVTLIHTVNPGHRVTPAGGAALRQLGEALNAFAGAHDSLRRQVAARVDEANARLEEEKNRLAALMSELADSVLVCNREGRILLYNQRAARLLAADAGPAGPGAVGLGRSVFGIFDQGQVMHALDRLGRQLEQRIAHPVARFVAAHGDQLLRAQMVPVLDAQAELGGFVLVLEDVTRSVASDSRRESLLRQLTEGTRASLANIRAAVETMQQYPDMEAERRRRFTDVVRDEAEQLSMRLDAAAAADAESPGRPWPLEDMLSTDLVHALLRSMERRLGITAAARDDGEALWLSVDSHALVQALTRLMGRLVERFAIRSVVVETAAVGRFARLSLCWAGPAAEPDLLRQWQAEPHATEAGGRGPTLDELLQRHNAEVWLQADRAAGLNRICLQLPAARALQPIERTPPGIDSRPVYYDFDLFHQPGQTPELDETPLAELSCTVFDTETTGLAPSDGDEIISIGAVRIVNGRLLRQECFDRLVRPQRSVRRESQRIHGISNEMLADQPTIAEVLPMFRRFAAETVLVAHNAAFDMRFLQLAEPRTGITFTQPVLDTLMLSALVHPGHPDVEHRLELIAARLGVPVAGRHTALGDAIVTGEVFLKLVPLLAERGIRTLGQARDASQKTLYAKLEY
jgi:DNA polymerase-3 subunit epsilon